MAVSTTDARVKEVLPVLADFYSRENMLLDRCTDLKASLGKGESIDLPSIGEFTVTADGDTGVGAGNAQTITTSAENMIVDKLPTIFAKIPKKDRIFNLGDGSWGAQVGRIAAMQLKNYNDDELVEYLLGTPAWDTAGTYHINPAGATVTSAMFRTALARARSLDGLKRLEWWVSPYGEGAISQIADFVPNQAQVDTANLGIRQIGTLFGLPVIETTAIKTDRTVATSAVTISSNVATATVAAGHGLVPGQFIYTTGLTTNVASTAKVAIQTVTSTTVVFALTDSNGAMADGVGLIIPATGANMLVDLEHIFKAEYGDPDVEIIPQNGTLTDEMRVFSLLGRKARTNTTRPSVYVIHSANDSVT